MLIAIQRSNAAVSALTCDASVTELICCSSASTGLFVEGQDTFIRFLIPLIHHVVIATAQRVHRVVTTLMLALLCSLRLSIWFKMDCWRSAAMTFMRLTREGRINIGLDQKD
jgi:hypothetical protein